MSATTTDLGIYSKSHFPAAQIIQLLRVSAPSYSRRPLLGREFSIDARTYDDKEFQRRYLAAETGEELKKILERDGLQGLHIGPCYAGDIEVIRGLSLGRPEPQWREIVFDIDLDDYADVRACQCDKSTCEKCWPLAVVGARVLEFFALEILGATHCAFVFSGRRGLHCWLLDPRYSQLTNTEEREALLQGLNSEELRNKIYERVLKSEFARCLLIGAVTHEKLRDIALQEFALLGLSASRQRTLQQTLSHDSLRKPKEYWQQICHSARQYTDGAQTAEQLLRAIVFRFTWPRLDTPVTCAPKHLLRCPMFVHPANGNISVVMDSQALAEFRVADVPTLRGILSGGVAVELFAKYVSYLELVAVDGAAVAQQKCCAKCFKLSEPLSALQCHNAEHTRQYKLRVLVRWACREKFGEGFLAPKQQRKVLETKKKVYAICTKFLNNTKT